MHLCIYLCSQTVYMYEHTSNTNMHAKSLYMYVNKYTYYLHTYIVMDECKYETCLYVYVYMLYGCKL